MDCYYFYLFFMIIKKIIDMIKMINNINLPINRKLTKIKQGDRNYLLCLNGSGCSLPLNRIR
jgi:hypothetical protein